MDPLVIVADAKFAELPTVEDNDSIVKPTKVGMLPTIADKDVADNEEVTNEPTNTSVAASDPTVIVPATRVVVLPYAP